MRWTAFCTIAVALGCNSPVNPSTHAPEAQSTMSTSSAEIEKNEPNPWRNDPKLLGRFLPDYPDDLQVIIHDGGPRFTDKPPELVWVRVTGRESTAFRGTVLNQPSGLKTVKQGDSILFLACKDKKHHPFLIGDRYLQERGKWVIEPCNKCGFTELFDTPPDLIHKIFPNVPKDGTMEAFTTFCPLCRGVQVVHQPGLDIDKPISVEAVK